MTVWTDRKCTQTNECYISHVGGAKRGSFIKRFDCFNKCSVTVLDAPSIVSFALTLKAGFIRNVQGNLPSRAIVLFVHRASDLQELIAYWIFFYPLLLQTINRWKMELYLIEISFYRSLGYRGKMCSVSKCFLRAMHVRVLIASPLNI